MFLDNKKIFLAGSTGMAGTSILRYLLDNAPTAKIRASYHITEPIIKHKQVEYARGDLRSLKDCRTMAAGCHCAIMAAAYAGGAGFMKSFPWEHMIENLMMNLKMLEAFHRENVKRIVYISSATLYQQFEGNIKEDQLDLNEEPHEAYFGYAWSVRFIEKMCKFLHQKYGMEIVIARAANIFGPNDKFSPDFSNFIPAIIRKAVDKMGPFELWGTPDVTRDVIYSNDFARAIVMMADNEQIKFDIFNVGSGVKTTVGNIAEWALKYSGHTPSEIKYLHNKPTTIKFRALDCTKAKRLLGWEPQYTIEEGVRKTTQWWLENKETWKK
ncbi:MAG: NAD-dependent epimerase/dehydratase family protein [Planctomycetota bacterium]|jgi:nucleoside-diphosphate-sugar epimerase